MPNEVDIPSDDSADDGINRQITELVIAYLDGKEVGERSRASMIATITGLSIQHARRRLAPNGPPWVVSELGKIAQYFGDSLATLLSGTGPDTSCSGEVCEIELEGRWYGAQARVEAVASAPKVGELVAVRHGHRWRLTPIEKVPAGSEAHQVAHVSLFPRPSQNIRVAVLDDDASLARSLRDDLIGGGFSVTAFNSEEQLSGWLHHFDVFIIDFVLGSGKTASDIVQKIRDIKPDAPIVLLTGHAREAVSSEIANAVEMHRVEVLEKPAQIMILQSLIAGRSLERRLP
jgi:ActR/RegA family two-component response regulator